MLGGVSLAAIITEVTRFRITSHIGGCVKRKEPMAGMAHDACSRDLLISHRVGRYGRISLFRLPRERVATCSERRWASPENLLRRAGISDRLRRNLPHASSGNKYPWGGNE